MVDDVTKHLLFSDTVKFLHGYITQPTVSPADRIVHALNFLLCAIKYVFAFVHHEHISDISSLCDIFSNFIPSMTLSPPTPDLVPSLPLPVPVLPIQGHTPLPLPRFVPLQRLVPLPTRSRLALTAYATSRRKYPSNFINNWAFSGIDSTTGQTL